MATATNFTAKFMGVSGTPYFINGYISDVKLAVTTFSPQSVAVAGSPGYVTFKERVRLKDLSIVTGPTVMTALTPTSNENQLQNSSLPIAMFLTTIQNRPELNYGFEAGSRISFIQN